ncbi:hypothetical protein [Picrophilus oshimae]|uniref:Uncharacterized protein n=1 Tax=Picrophilus torridus (strain ATCC 700027 / DSM 9790 / JCM 10055 / NBRC 100828 / KAW 2/3) TaxID=1122961 RepID=A0A8G2FX50_PICTO|nr:hypothetical protein [Picrophilus oshimae]SMD31081.1 hypothetical protein SAMN02745355_1001 [Picrophilus oshimae DSM 9789]
MINIKDYNNKRIAFTDNITGSRIYGTVRKNRYGYYVIISDRNIEISAARIKNLEVIS